MTDSVLNELKKKVNKAVSIKKKITEYSKLLETLKDSETVIATLLQELGEVSRSVMNCRTI